MSSYDQLAQMSDSIHNCWNNQQPEAADDMKNAMHNHIQSNIYESQNSQTDTHNDNSKN
jgi:hypothetical protein